MFRMFSGSATNNDVFRADLVLEDVLQNTSRAELKELPKDKKLIKHYVKFDDLLSKGKKEFTHRFNRQFCLDTPVYEYNFLRILGTGAYGNVVLAKKHGNYYAAKIMEKKSIIKTNQLYHVHNEIRMLDAMHFEFLIYLEDFIRTNCNVILVLPFIRGGEMFEYMRNRGKCDEFQAKFYASQVVLAFEYMHAMGVIYRDLKPENVLLDEFGYIKLADFGFCKKVDSDRTWTLCGTPEYLAPEIILNNGYNRSVDWWAFGVFVYEMAAGFPPFANKDSMKLYEKIVSGVFSFPPHFSTHLRDLLSNVIQVDKSKRFGVLKHGARDIKGHPWFRAIDWNGIMDRSTFPPYKPQLSADDDVTHFRDKPFYAMKDCPDNEYEEEFAVISNKQLGTKQSSRGLNVFKKMYDKSHQK